MNRGLRKVVVADYELEEAHSLPRAKMSPATGMFTVNQPKSDGFFSALFSVGMYKPNQGRIARQLVGGVGAVVVILLCWSMSLTLLADIRSTGVAISTVVAVLGVWAVYRCVNWPQFADFLIEVQHEMAKVSWPTWAQLKRSTTVVLCAMGLLSFVLFCYDLVWHWLLRLVQVLQF